MRTPLSHLVALIITHSELNKDSDTIELLLCARHWANKPFPYPSHLLLHNALRSAPLLPPILLMRFRGLTEVKQGVLVTELLRGRGRTKPALTLEAICAFRTLIERKEEGMGWLELECTDVTV